MEYIITTKNVGIKLCGARPVTCLKTDAQHFDEAKARNILTNLPKTLRRMHFNIVPVGTKSQKEEAVPEVKVKEVKATIKQPVELPETITRWKDKVSSYNGLAVEASARAAELTAALSEIDKQKVNVEHAIELSGRCNACEGYKLFKNLKDVMLERRLIKDELLIVNAVLSCTLENLSKQQIEKAISGLEHRTYTYR